MNNNKGENKMSLSNRALLANLTISQWTGRKLDKIATDTVEINHKTEGKVGNYTKKLLPNARELEEVNRHAASIRAFFYEQSLPWHTDGARIISAKNYLDFINAFKIKKQAFDASVSEFITAYPTLMEKARLKLGDLFRETEYPTIEKLQNSFQCEVNFLPMPDVSDFRTEILESEKESFLAKMKQVEVDAMRECWNRLFTVVDKAANRIADPSAILRDSLIENIQEICQLLPRLNISNDPALESMRLNVEKTIAGISVDACREFPQVRDESAKKLADIMNTMSSFMGMAA
jgi:hypothetical protein